MKLGLRAQIIAVLAVVSVLTLAVATLTLLSPLDRRLQNNALRSFAVALRNERGAVSALPEGAFVAGDARLLRVARLLARHNGAAVTVVTPTGRVLVSTDPDDTRGFRTIGDAARSSKTQRLLTHDGPRTQAEVSFAVGADRRRVIVVARKPVTDTESATAVVRRAFTVTAAIGLAAALIVGLLLAGRLVSRVRRLRDTTLRVAEIGPDAELKPDRGRDEIGDLSRAFATMQERLREQELARRSFVATASHELRTPLASLSVIVDMLLDDLRAAPPDVASAEAQAARAEAQVQRLSLLAAELLDLSRIDAKVPLRSELVELSPIVRSVAAELDVRLGAEERTIAIAGDPVVWAVGDPGSVAQIVRVLLDNAVRHAPAGPVIETRTEVRDGMAQVRVADDGPGVPPEDRERIFERFARGSRAVEGGFGLGLAIGRELARKMDGDVVLEDRPAGSCFVLSLPAAPTP